MKKRSTVKVEPRALAYCGKCFLPFVYESKRLTESGEHWVEIWRGTCEHSKDVTSTGNAVKVKVPKEKPIKAKTVKTKEVVTTEDGMPLTKRKKRNKIEE